MRRDECEQTDIEHFRVILGRMLKSWKEASSFIPQCNTEEVFLRLRNGIYCGV